MLRPGRALLWRGGWQQLVRPRQGLLLLGLGMDLLHNRTQQRSVRLHGLGESSQRHLLLRLGSWLSTSGGLLFSWSCTPLFTMGRNMSRGNICNRDAWRWRLGDLAWRLLKMYCQFAQGRAFRARSLGQPLLCLCRLRCGRMLCLLWRLRWARLGRRCRSARGSRQGLLQRLSMRRRRTRGCIRRWLR